MLDFAEITIEDKILFDSYLKSYKPETSELTFTNLFMWRNFYKLRYVQVAGFLCIISVPDRGRPFSFVPIGVYNRDAFEEAVYYIKSHFYINGWDMDFRRLTKHEAALFGGLVKSEEDIIPDRDSSDYIYLTDNLMHLSGKKFDGKRNHINKFKKNYEFEYTVLDMEYYDECVRIMDQWCAERSCDEHKEFYCEKLANLELLKNYEKLDCKGALIKVDGKYEAFTVGEMLNEDTAVIHIEKANNRINGLYTFINQQFCENQWNKTKYINREQDLGIQGLRKAKLSYNPVKLIDKYSVSIR